MKALTDTCNKKKVLVGGACEIIKECLVADVARVVLATGPGVGGGGGVTVAGSD